MNKQTFSIIATDDNFTVQSDESYPGHFYIIESTGHAIKQEIEFQRGPVKEVGYNGITSEHLLAILIDRLKVLNQGKYACRENSIALTKLEEALMWLNKRTENRKARGIEGTNEV